MVADELETDVEGALSDEPPRPPAALRDDPRRHPAALVVTWTRVPGLLGRRFSLGADVATIGSHPTSDLVLADPRVSARHARIERGDDGFRIVDEGSAEGTFLNDERAQRATPFAAGDVLGIGSSTLELLAEEGHHDYHQLLYRLTIIDGLTRLHNARYLVEALEREITRARRYDRLLSVLVLRVVQPASEQAGREHDVAWRVLARAVAGRVRHDDLVARSGDDEITVVLPDRGHEEAQALARELEGLSCSLPVALRATSATLGVADATVAELLRRASDAST